MAVRSRWLVVAVGLAALNAGCTPPGGGDSPYRYVVPVDASANVAYGSAGSHAGYPAADIFASAGCGTPLVAPVDGRVLEVRTVDLYDPATDNPARRGGRYVSIEGVDGVRYYLAHLDSVAAGLAPGQAVGAGQVVGTMGRTGPGRRLPSPPRRLASLPRQGVGRPARGRVAPALPGCLAPGRDSVAGA